MAGTPAWFHDYETDYETTLREATAKYGRASALRRVGSRTEFYTNSVLNRGNSGDMAVDQADISYPLLENALLACGRPYYRIYPDYAKMFDNTSLDIPFRYVRAAYPAQIVRFQAGSEPRYGDRRVMSFAFSVCSLQELSRAMLSDLGDEYHTRIICTMAVDAIDGKRGPKRFSGTMSWDGSIDPDMTVAEVVALHSKGTTRVDVMAVTVSLWRIALAVAFLATGGDKLIEPDIVNADFRAYLAAVNAKDKAAAAAIAAASVRARQDRHGHTVGRADQLLGRRADYHDHEVGADKVEVERHLTYSHMRGGHVRFIRRGEQRVGVWVRPTVVRPDLPSPPETRTGARTLTSKAAEAAILT